ncbi:MAG: serine--tRNA ligase [Firmicutes bacterium]|nr:serine--tRNA ligase [Bacillota bacterium]
MLDINLIRQNPDWVADRLAKRMPRPNFKPLLKLDDARRKLMAGNETARAQRNMVTAEIARLKKNNPNDAQIPQMIDAMKSLGDQIAAADKKIAAADAKQFALLATFPNIPLTDVIPGGKESNAEVRNFGEQPKFDFKPKDHVELCTKLGLIDYERGTKMSGSGHWIYVGMGARLEWALWSYFMDFHVQNGYTMIMPPHILNYESGYAAGQFPKFDEDVFFVMKSKRGRVAGGRMEQQRFLIPTSETAIINMHRGETLAETQLPIRYAGFSPCYRGEPGGYGASERGTIRGHQFNKIEMFIFCTPEESQTFHAELVRNAEKLCEGLGLHYKTMLLAAGDTGAAMAKTYDVEVFIPSLGYKECSSVSNAWDYQARRANIRAKMSKIDCSGETCTKTTTTDYIHTLNASGLATSRLIPAIVEQFQNPDGSVNIPEVLQKYLNGTKILLPV